MKRKWKIVLVVLLVLLISGGVFASIKLNERGIVTVQTGHVARQDITAIVTASGEIKPKNYINLGANAMGPITDIFVKEGDHVTMEGYSAKDGSHMAQTRSVTLADGRKVPGFGGGDDSGGAPTQ